MKKIISVMLVFAAIASLMTVSGFATDAATAESLNGFFGEITTAFADFVAPLMDDYNCGSSDIIFDTGFNDFLTDIDSFMETLVIGLIDLVATVENLFA